MGSPGEDRGVGRRSTDSGAPLLTSTRSSSSGTAAASGDSHSHRVSSPERRFGGPTAGERQAVSVRLVVELVEQFVEAVVLIRAVDIDHESVVSDELVDQRVRHAAIHP